MGRTTMTPPCKPFRQTGLEDSVGCAIAIEKTPDLRFSRLGLSPDEVEALKGHLAVAPNDWRKTTVAPSIRSVTPTMVHQPWFENVMEHYLQVEAVSVEVWVPEHPSGSRSLALVSMRTMVDQADHASQAALRLPVDAS